MKKLLTRIALLSTLTTSVIGLGGVAVTQTQKDFYNHKAQKLLENSQVYQEYLIEQNHYEQLQYTATNAVDNSTASDSLKLGAAKGLEELLKHSREEIKNIQESSEFKQVMLTYNTYELKEAKMGDRAQTVGWITFLSVIACALLYDSFRDKKETKAPFTGKHTGHETYT